MTGKKPRWALRIAAGVLFLVVALAAGAFLLRDAIASSIAGRELEGRGMHCAPLAVHLAWDLSSVDLAPATCTLVDGRIASVALPSGAHVALAGRKPVAVSTDELDLVLRDTELPEGAAGAMLGGDVPEPMARLLDALGRLAAQDDVPAVRIEVLSVEAHAHVVYASSVRLGRGADGALAATVASVAPPPHVGPLLEVGGGLEHVRVRATPTDAAVSGALVLDAALGPVAVERSVAFRLSGAGLGGPSAQYTMWVERTPRMERLRALYRAWQARRAAGETARDALRDAVRDERGAGPDAPGGRIRGLLEKLRERHGQ